MIITVYKNSSNIKTIILLLLGLILTYYTTNSLAATSCANVFPGALQTNAAAPNGNISFGQNTAILHNPSNILQTVTITNATNNLSCGTGVCSKSGTPSAILDPGNFQYNQNGSNITIKQGASQTLGTNNITDYGIITMQQASTAVFNAPSGGVYRINTLTVAADSLLILAPGDYWIENFYLGPGSEIDLSGTTGQVRLMILNSTIFDKDIYVNPDLNIASRLLIYAFNNVTIAANSYYSNYSNIQKYTNINSLPAIDQLNLSTIYLIQDPNSTQDPNLTYVIYYDYALLKWYYFTEKTDIFNTTFPNGNCTAYQIAQYYYLYNVFNGYIYAIGNVSVQQNIQFSGAISAKNISLGQNTIINYNDSAAVLDLTNTCNFIPSLTHFVIQNGNTGNFCIPSPIKVTAYNGNNIVTNFNGTIKLYTGTGTGTWSLDTGFGTLLDPITNDGIAYYTFSPQDQGVATFNLLYTNGAGIINISAQLRYNSKIHDTGSAGAINITSNSFLLTSAPLPNPLPPLQNIVSYATPQTAGITTPIYITAFGVKPNLTCGILTNYKGSKAIQFWQNYINPSSGTKINTVNNITIGTTSANAVTIPITFTQGTASFNSLYRDVGMLTIYAQDPTRNPNLIGNTSNYVVKPAKLAITNIANNPAAVDANGAIFVKAGAPFTVQVTVQDNNGNTTPNYGNELIPEGISLYASSLVAPTTGRNGAFNNGTIGNNTAFSKTAPGVFQGTTFYYDEVGIIKLTAQVADGNYIGAGNVFGPESGNVGRFIPDHFAVNANVPILNTGCNAGRFSYLNQKITYNIAPIINFTAQSVLNSTTQNYQGAFWKMNNANITTTYSSNGSPATLNTIQARAATNVTSNNNGTGSITLSDGGGISFNKISNTNIANFNAEIQASVTIKDADNVSYTNNPYSFGNTAPNTGIGFTNGNAIYQGRISLANNYGSETLPLTIPVKIEYFNGNDYVLNTQDSCTSINNASSVNLTKTPTNLATTATIGNFIAGIGKIILTAPNIVGHANILLDLSAAGANLPYLQHFWPQFGNDGLFDDNPMALGSFGIYHGNDKVIYFREVTD